MLALAACEDDQPMILDTIDNMGVSLCTYFFKFDSVEIIGGDKQIEGCARHLRHVGVDKRFVIEVFADRVGSESYNLDLSLRRGNAVKEGLSRHGFSSSNLEVRGLGRSNPQYKNAPPELSRRVEIREACPGGMQGVGPGGTPNCR